MTVLSPHIRNTGGHREDALPSLDTFRQAPRQPSPPASSTARALPAGGPLGARELVMVGVFAATAKVATLLTAMAGGGMNPIALVLKSCVFTTLLVVLLCRIRKPGALMLFIIVNLLAGLLLMGNSLTLLPPMLVGAVAAEGVLAAGAGREWAPYAAAAVYDLLYKALSLLLSYAFMRESPGLMLLVTPVVAVGWLGSLLGLYCGNRLVKELRHAGFAER